MTGNTAMRIHWAGPDRAQPPDHSREAQGVEPMPSRSLAGQRREAMCKPIAVGPDVRVMAYECNRATCVSIEAPRLAGPHCAGLADQILQIIGRMPHPQIVIDLAKVDSISLGIAGEFVACFKTVRSQGRTVHLAGLNDELNRAFRFLDINRFANVYTDINDALCSSAKPRRWWHLGRIA